MYCSEVSSVTKENITCLTVAYLEVRRLGIGLSEEPG